MNLKDLIGKLIAGNATGYYKTLGVKNFAKRDQVKKAYHNLALKYHPDKNKGKDAERKFQDINEAYRVLSHPDKKAAYDLDLKTQIEVTQGKKTPAQAARVEYKKETNLEKKFYLWVLIIGILLSLLTIFLGVRSLLQNTPGTFNLFTVPRLGK